MGGAPEGLILPPTLFLLSPWTTRAFMEKIKKPPSCNFSREAASYLQNPQNPRK